MLSLMLAAVLGASAPTDSGGRFLAVAYRVGGSDLVSYTQVYDRQAEASRAAERIALCGFWRVDLVTLETSLVAAGAVQAVHLMDPDQQPPPLDGGPTIPPPDIERIVQCVRMRAGPLN